jgi:hypothetical protein
MSTKKIKDAFTESTVILLRAGYSATRVELKDLDGNIIGRIFMYTDDDHYWR